MGLLVMVANAVPAQAVNSVGTSPICIGSMTLSFSPPVTAIPNATTAVSVSGGTATCRGLSNPTVTWSTQFAMTGIEVSCEEIVALGSVSFNGTTVTALVAGPTPVQSWTFVDTANRSVFSTGVFAWTDTNSLVNCLSGVPITSMNLSVGVFVLVTL